MSKRYLDMEKLILVYFSLSINLSHLTSNIILQINLIKNLVYLFQYNILMLI